MKPVCMDPKQGTHIVSCCSSIAIGWFPPREQQIEAFLIVKTFTL